VGLAVISSIDSIRAAGALRALFGGMVAAIVVVIMSRSGRKGGTSLENNSNLITYNNYIIISNLRHAPNAA
jgi:hypothetical protein